MDFWRRAARRSKPERIRNEMIREMMEVQNTLVDEYTNRTADMVRLCLEKARGTIATEGHRLVSH